MKIYDFTGEHIAEAQKLALSCYEEERRHVPELPDRPVLSDLPSGIRIPSLSAFAENGPGIAAYE